MKLRKLEGGWVMWWCPACKMAHGGEGWKETDPLTVNASADIKYPDGTRCHSAVWSGKIRFQLDCSNGWACRIVDLPDFPV